MRERAGCADIQDPWQDDSCDERPVPPHGTGSQAHYQYAEVPRGDATEVTFPGKGPARALGFIGTFCRRRSLLPPVILILLLVSNCATVFADSSWEKILSDPRLERARHIAGEDDEGAVKLLEAVIRENPHTQLAGAAKLEIAHMMADAQDKPGALRIIEEIIAEMPDTPIAFLSEDLAIDLRRFPLYDPSAWVHETDLLIRKIGGKPYRYILNRVPGLETLLSERDGQERVQFRAPVPFLSDEDQRSLLEYFYLAIACDLFSQSQAGHHFGFDRVKVRAALKMLHFMRENFSGAGLYDITNYALWTHGFNGKSEFPPDKTPPRIRKFWPDSRHTVGDRSVITILTDDGDIREDQINVAGIQLEVDGNDVTRHMGIQTSYDLSARFDVVFEKMRLTYQPPLPLSPGPHSVHVRIPDYAKNVIDSTWTFTVRTRHDLLRGRP